jgi:hypothetical protein
MLSDPTAGLRVQMVPGTWQLVIIQNLLILLTSGLYRLKYY